MKFLRETLLLSLTTLTLLPIFGCGDYYRPVANPIVSPGGQPQTAHYAWVVNFNPNGDGSTTEIDVSGDTNLAVNSMGAGSIAEAFPFSSLALYVANNGDDTVSEYLPTLAGSITTITLLPGSHPIALTSQQNTSMFVLNSGTNSACPTTGSMSVISTATLSVSHTVCVGVNPVAFVQTVANGFIYVLNQGDNTVSVINPTGPAVVGLITTATGLGQNPVSVTTSTDGSWIFIVTQGNGTGPGTLDIVPAGSASIAASVPLGVGPTFSVVDTNLNHLYVANTTDNTVSVFDTTSVNTSSSPAMTLLATVQLNSNGLVGTGPVGVTPLQNGSVFYVANAGSDNVTVVSASSFSPLTTVPLPAGAGPVWIASDPTSSKVYVADKGAGETTIINTADNSVAQNMPAPAQVSGCTTSCALQQPVMIVTQ